MNLIPKGKRETEFAARQRRHQEARRRGPRLRRFHLTWAAGFIVYAAALVTVAFLGLDPAEPLIVQGEETQMRIVADIPFTYESEILTRQKREQRRRQVPPIYRVSLEPYQDFAVRLEAIEQYLASVLPAADNAEAPPVLPPRNAFAEPLQDELAGSPFPVDIDDVYRLAGRVTPDRRQELWGEGLAELHELYLRGIYDPEVVNVEDVRSSFSLFEIYRDEETAVDGDILSADEAERVLRVTLSALDVPRDVYAAIYRIMRAGLVPNLVYDEERHTAKIEELLAQVPPETVTVRRGHMIIAPGIRVTEFHLEQLRAYRQALENDPTVGILSESLFLERTMFAMLVLLAAVLFLSLFPQALALPRNALNLAALMLLLNVAAIRVIFTFGDTAELAAGTSFLAAIIPFLAPVALAPIIVATFTGVGPAAFIVVMLAAFNALMQGNSLTVFVGTLITGFIAVFLSRKIQVRTTVIKAGFFSGLVMGLLAIIFGVQAGLEFTLIAKQGLAAVAAGIVTGMVAVGVIPLAEKLFHFTTDITLLELTDYNHPLLRRMQIIAPGSYHHSLMVANLSENAAAMIGANPLVCRVCALFHDIGKTIKPEYYTENQRGTTNPHLERNPSMSALVIKSHVKEGVVLARQYKLPKIIIDVIRQHHGTTLIQYFYYKALQKQRGAGAGAGNAPNPYPDAPAVNMEEVNESTYRYDGPKPQFKESAIIFFADSIEAASRSLKKVTPQSVAELVDRIFGSRIADEQLSDTPLTLMEIDRIKQSFTFTLLNSLHSRIEYPKEPGDLREEQRPAKPADEGSSTSAPSTPASTAHG